VSAIKLNKHKIFKKTDNVLFYDISIKESNASDLVIHESAAVSPPDDELGNKQFYIHSHQIDNNRVISGSRTFELINFDWDRPYQIIKLNRDSGALKIPLNTYHRSVSGEKGSIVINQAQRDELFETNKEFLPVSVVKNEKLNNILKKTKPIIYKI
jgi:hypothetical protein